jgi:hypothetical protein
MLKNQKKTDNSQVPVLMQNRSKGCINIEKISKNSLLSISSI